MAMNYRKSKNTLIEEIWGSWELIIKWTSIRMLIQGYIKRLKKTIGKQAMNR